MKRKIVQVIQSPMNEHRWFLTLECGHCVWISAYCRPEHRNIICEECEKPHIGGFLKKTSELMRKLWESAEDAERDGRRKEAWLLTVAGNIVEDISTQNNDVRDIVNKAMDNADDCFARRGNENGMF